jgi:hypothetical protein
MKFEITKSDDYKNKDQPCKSAILENFPWKDKTRQAWTVEVSSLEDLLNIMKETKYPLVIEESGIWTNLPYLEVYNTYRE